MDLSRRLVAPLSLGAAGLILGAVAIGAATLGSGGDQFVPPPNPSATAAAPTPSPAPTGAIPVNVARDGPLPTPTPTPIPRAVAHCYSPRGEPPAGVVLQPASERSIFRNCQVVAFYGYPSIPGLGVLGDKDPDAMTAQLREQAEAYDATNGSRGVALAYHMIAAVAQGHSTADGTFLERIPHSVIDAYLEAAEQHDAIVILDIQMGTSTVDAELEAIAPYLRHPRVHLALDPEWHMPDGVTPGTQIGSMDAAEINRAQEILQAVVDETGLPNKILVIHQFTRGMITNKGAIASYPGVDLVIDQDGFGYAGAKTGNYDVFVRQDGAEHGGMKIFYTEDFPPLITPAEANALVPQPDLIVYQ
ncbi:MAG: hypothetical protein Kow0010_15880 [Dehalococcoidia bacterium]